MRMRNRLVGLVALILFSLSVASCVIFEKKHLPPGQGKKLTGQQNASTLAPGKK